MNAKKIRTKISFDGKNQIDVYYDIEGFGKDVVNIVLPSKVSLNKTHLSLVGWIASIVLAKLCLAEEIILDFPISADMVKSGLPILELLYDARCYRDQIDLMPVPKINILQEIPFLQPLTFKQKPNPVHAQLLWSGGKDSTLSFLLLQANGYNVSGYHATINADTKQIEMESARDLGNLFSQGIDYININPRPFAEIGTHYSPTFGKYPKHNSIPQGRDFILFSILSIISTSKDSNLLCSGSEYELYSKVISYQGKSIYRHDAQSLKGYELISQYLNQWHTQGFKVFSPVAPLTEFRSFKVLSNYSPKSFDYISSCFWGNWCGKCLKCFRYALIQKTLGLELIRFQEDPLTSNNFLDFYINEWKNTNITYREEIYYCLNILSEQRNLLENYEKLNYYAKEMLPQSKYLNAQYFDYLHKTHQVHSLPEMFNPDLLG